MSSDEELAGKLAGDQSQRLRHHIEGLYRKEIESVRSEATQGRLEHILKSLDERGRGQELIRQQYTGRYPFELLQNANDAAGEACREGRTRFVLTDESLMVADNGIGFGIAQVNAICGLGRSSKDPGKSIGYKGLGFKSVGEISRRPQVICPDVRFGFDGDRARRDVENVAGTLLPTQRLPAYAMPFILEDEDLGGDARLVDELLADGFSTVFRLPFRDGVTRTAVDEQLHATLSPRLLLFLRHIHDLELHGSQSDFRAVVHREQLPAMTEVRLTVDGARSENWLVFSRLYDVVDRELVAALDDAWASVEKVSVGVAVPLDSDGLPARDPTPQPLHVYFPTEQSSGLGVVLHADFALELDRKRIGSSPETIKYNRWLSEMLAKFVGNTVAPALASRFPGSGRVVRVLAPRVPHDAAWTRGFESLMVQLRRSVFVPTADGRVRYAAEALSIPDSVPNASDAHHYLVLPGRTLLAEIEEDACARDFARELLAVEQMPMADALRNPGTARNEDTEGYYAFLLAWWVRHGRYHGDLIPSLRESACVRLKSGAWVSPSERVYFPRERGDVDLPEGLRVPIADLPDLPHLRSLMEDLGVKSFEWRNLLNDYVLPPLTDPMADDGSRASCLELLAYYFRTNSGGARAVREQVGRALLPARDSTGTDRTLTPANRCYFPSEWTGNDRLEIVYGTFGEAEFLDVEAPAPGDGFHERYEFYRALGVQDRPRILEAVAAAKDLYRIRQGKMPVRHPHRDADEHWKSWEELDSVQTNRNCQAGHTGSQQLKSSFQLDRFHQILDRSEPAELTALWMMLAEHWGDTYQPAMSAVFRCHHGGHGGERERKAPSLFAHMLSAAAWVPACTGADKVLEVGSDVWRAGLDTPGHIRRTVPLLLAELDVAGSVGLISTLGIVDAARPRPAELVGLLEQLARQHDPENPSEKSDAFDAARWAMRKLNDALLHEDLPQGAEVKLLARCGARRVFVSDPVVASDPHLADSWSERLPIYDGDRENRRLQEALGLRRLENLVTVTPHPNGRLPEERERVLAHFRARRAVLAAVALKSAPSRRDVMIKHLRRLELDVCRKLVLRYEHDGHIIQRDTPTSYIADRVEGPGNARRKVGTAWIEIDPNTNRPNWFEFATHLAEYLEVATHADAFALVLRSDLVIVEDFVASRQVDDATIQAIRVDLDAVDGPVPAPAPVTVPEQSGSGEDEDL